MQLTKSAIDKIQYTKINNSRQFIWDAEISGFGLRVYPSGKKSFVLSYWMKGRNPFETIWAAGKRVFLAIRGAALQIPR